MSAKLRLRSFVAEEERDKLVREKTRLEKEQWIQEIITEMEQAKNRIDRLLDGRKRYFGR